MVGSHHRPAGQRPHTGRRPRRGLRPAWACRAAGPDRTQGRGPGPDRRGHPPAGGPRRPVRGRAVSAGGCRRGRPLWPPTPWSRPTCGGPAAERVAACQTRVRARARRLAPRGVTPTRCAGSASAARAGARWPVAAAPPPKAPDARQLELDAWATEPSVVALREQVAKVDIGRDALRAEVLFCAQRAREHSDNAWGSDAWSTTLLPPRSGRR